MFRFCDAIQSDRRLLTFRRKALPPTSRFINQPKNKQVNRLWRVILYMFFRNVDKSLSDYTSKHSRKEFSSVVILFRTLYWNSIVPYAVLLCQRFPNCGAWRCSGGHVRLWQKRLKFNVKCNWKVQFILGAFSHLLCKQPFNLLIPCLNIEIWATRFQRLLALFIDKSREASRIFILKI